MISLISSFSPKLYLNLLVYYQNIFGSSLKAFGNLRKFYDIFGKGSGTFVWPSEQCWKIFGNLRKSLKNGKKRRHQYVYIIKEHYTRTWLDQYP